MVHGMLHPAATIVAWSIATLMPEEPYVKPKLIILDLPKPEVTALRKDLLAEDPARELEDREVKLIVAKIASKLREKQAP